MDELIQQKDKGLSNWILSPSKSQEKFKHSTSKCGTQAYGNISTGKETCW